MYRSSKEWADAAESYQYIADQRRKQPSQKTFGWIVVALLAFLGGTVLLVTQVTADTPVPLVVGVSMGLMFVGYCMLWVWWDRRRGK